MEIEKQTTRKRILEAAYYIIKTFGISRLTIDVVCKEAGLSKGGFLYHFPSKEALIKGMIDDMYGQYVVEIEDEIAADSNDIGKNARAYLKVTFLNEENEFQLSAGVLAALVNTPSQLEPVRDIYKDWQDKMENDNIDPAIATICRLASDGLWYADLFNFAPLKDPDLRQRVLSILTDMSRGKLNYQNNDE
ncbi:TetR/AcrR family transcriptional regulator [Bacillus massiliigorillae]|uniref:TetR/AcrR family transcriptional regulator n=1 Tax=Bacillus massiliigorillae TaxID=1243664 RepID=UPI0003A09756|nr:TetR/AcrR family transcriptional regulator [Bacillus massiliigorillae]